MGAALRPVLIMSRSDVWSALTQRFYSWRGGIGQAPGGVASLIAELPVSIIIVRQNPTTHAKQTLAAQTVRVDLATAMNAPLEYGRSPSSSVTNKQKVIVLGFFNSPTGEADTDLKLMDSFLWENQQFTIRKIEFMNSDRVIAEAEAEG